MKLAGSRPVCPTDEPIGPAGVPAAPAAVAAGPTGVPAGPTGVPAGPTGVPAGGTTGPTEVTLVEALPPPTGARSFPVVLQNLAVERWGCPQCGHMISEVMFILPEKSISYPESFSRPGHVDLIDPAIPAPGEITTGRIECALHTADRLILVIPLQGYLCLN